MSATLFLFYGIFLSQIFVISYYFPMKIRKRALYVLKNYPPAKYPRLYPKPYDIYAEKAAKNGFVGYRNLNLIIVAIGLGLVGWAIASGHSFSPLGGDENFVMLYFFLQVAPILFLEFGALKHFRQMRKAYTSHARKADLNPRRLFDFISPVLVLLAVFLFIGFVATYIFFLGFDAPWKWENYVTLGTMTGMNVFFAAIIAKFMFGKKMNPLQAHKDRLMHIETIVKNTVLVSIAASVFLIMTILADELAFELYDPVLTSLYFQAVIFLGIGLEFRKIKIEEVDFEVYKRDNPAGSA